VNFERETVTEESEAGGESRADAPSPGALFKAFLGIGLMGFGGVLAIARRMLVEDRRWLTPAEFTDLLALCQFLPGGNIMNLSVAVGLRFRGWRGAVAAIVGLVAVPCVIVVGLGIVYDHFFRHPVVARVFAGLGAAAAGLLIAVSIKIAAPLRTRPASAVMAVICLVVIAVFRFPLLPSMLVLAPASVLVAWRFEA
jgi:chromate transporter